MSDEFDTNETVLCFDQSYFYAARCVDKRYRDGEREYFICYTGRSEYEWVPTARVKKYSDENLMIYKALLSPNLKLNLETQTKTKRKEYYINCDSKVPVCFDENDNDDYDYSITDEQTDTTRGQSVKAAVKAIDAFIEDMQQNDIQVYHTKPKTKEVRFELNNEETEKSDTSFSGDYSLSASTPRSSGELSASSPLPSAVDETTDTTTDTTSHTNTESVLCFDGRLFYEAVCLDERKTSDEKRYFVHYVGWGHKWDEWVSESRILDITSENIEPHMHLIGFKSLSDSFKSRFPVITEKSLTNEDSFVETNRFSVGERVLCFDGKLFFEGICRETITIDHNAQYLIHYYGFGKALDEWVGESRLLKRTEKNIDSHRSLIARIDGYPDDEELADSLSYLKFK